MLAMCPLRNLAVLLPCLAVAGCADLPKIGAGLNLLTFQAAPGTGIVKGQIFEVHLLKRAATANLWDENFHKLKLPLPPDIEKSLVAKLRQHCSIRTKDNRNPAGVPPIFIPYIKQAGEYFYKFIVDQISDRAKQLADRSKRTYKKTLILDNLNNWDNTGCILLVRKTNKSNQLDGSQIGLGMVVLLVKTAHGQQRKKQGQLAFTLSPVFAHLVNGVAVTGVSSDSRPTIQLNIALGLKWVSTSKDGIPEIRDAAVASLPPLTMPVGADAPVCKELSTIALQECKQETGLIANFPVKAGIFAVDFAIVEVGSAADAEARAKAALDAINAVLQPRYNEALASLIKRLQD